MEYLNLCDDRKHLAVIVGHCSRAQTKLLSTVDPADKESETCFS